jgi:hypothetical protein
MGGGGDTRTRFFLHVLSISALLSPHTQMAGQCVIVFVKVNDAQRCLPASVELPSFHFLNRKHTFPPPRGRDFMESISFKRFQHTTSK